MAKLGGAYRFKIYKMGTTWFVDDGYHVGRCHSFSEAIVIMKYIAECWVDID